MQRDVGWGRAFWRRRSRRGKLVVVLVALFLSFALLGAFSERKPEAEGVGDAVERAAAPRVSAKAKPVRSAAAEKPATVGVPATFVIARVVDGDTVKLANGRVVRLVQIDAPELRPGECYGAQAASVLSRLLPVGVRVRLEQDASLDRVDQFGRQLAYVFTGRQLVQQTLVLRGAAAPWFYGGVKGRYADRLFRAAQAARAAERGLWKACAATRLNVNTALATRKPAPPATPPEAEPAPVVAAAAPAAAASCHPSYEGECLDPSASDYDCAGGSGNGPAYTGYVRVVGPDEYGLDADGDGQGCES